MHLHLSRLPSPLGELLIVTDTGGRLRALDFNEHEARMHDLLQRHYDNPCLQPGPVPMPIGDRLMAYFDGQLDAVHDLPVATMGSGFQARVWRALRHIPPGHTRSYGELAADLGDPSASRAVGLANSKNPIAIVVPCHRVIGKRGALTGYAGGLPRKDWLLTHERTHGAGGHRHRPAQTYASVPSAR